MKNLITLLITGIVIVSGMSTSSFAQGCMETSSDDGVQVIGYVQPQYSYYMFGEDPEGNARKPNSFHFKRARLGVAGSIPYDVSYYVMAEFSPYLGGPYLLDAFVTYSPFKKYLKFSMGQFKAPFSLELNTPCHALHTINRSTVVNQLASPFRELGFMLLGSTDSLFNKKDLLSYSVAVLNGTGLNTEDDNKYKDLAARLVIAPWDWLKFGGSYRTGLVGPKKVDTEQSSRERLGVELTFEGWNFLVQGEYIWGKDIGEIEAGGGCGKSALADAPQFDKSGFFVQAMYMTPINLQPVIKFETYDPDGGTYKYYDISQNYIQNTWTFGLNYFLNEWTRIQLNYQYNAEETGSVEHDNDVVMLQVQAKF